jgi:formylmethanofuran dehydrogenase subunit E
MMIGFLAVAATVQAQDTTSKTAPPLDVDAVVARILDYHGHVGPWAVIGYRAGLKVAKESGLNRASHDLIVEHHCPAAVQYTCMLDGLHAACGASVGKRTLRHVEAAPDRMKTVITDRVHGKTWTFTPNPSLVKAILNLPKDRLVAEARRVAALPDAELFAIEVVDTPAAAASDH